MVHFYYPTIKLRGVNLDMDTFAFRIKKEYTATSNQLKTFRYSEQNHAKGGKILVLVICCRSNTIQEFHKIKIRWC